MKWEAINMWGLILVNLQNKILLQLLIGLSLLCTGIAWAQDYETEELGDIPPVAEKKASSKETTLKMQFDDELVKGSQASPEVEYIFSRSAFNYKKMIRLRENFIPEVDKGKDEFRGK